MTNGSMGFHEFVGAYDPSTPVFVHNDTFELRYAVEGLTDCSPVPIKERDQDQLVRGIAQGLAVTGKLLEQHTHLIQSKDE